MTDKILIPILIPILVLLCWVGTFFLSYGWADANDKRLLLYINLGITFTGILYAFTPDKNKVVKLLSGGLVLTFTTGILWFLATKDLGPNATLNFGLFGGTLLIGHFLYISINKFRDEKVIIFIDFWKRRYFAKNPELFKIMLQQEIELQQAKQGKLPSQNLVPLPESKPYTTLEEKKEKSKNKIELLDEDIQNMKEFIHRYSDKIHAALKSTSINMGKNDPDNPHSEVLKNIMENYNRLRPEGYAETKIHHWQKLIYNYYQKVEIPGRPEAKCYDLDIEIK